MTNQVNSTTSKQVIEEMQSRMRQEYSTLGDDDIRSSLREARLPETEENMAKYREMCKIFIEKNIRSFGKHMTQTLERDRKRAERKGEILDPRPTLAQAAKSVEHAAGLKKMQERAEFLSGSCVQCQVKGLDLARQQKTLMKCEQCRKVMYCSPQCQKTDWPKHKKICQFVADPLKVMVDNVKRTFVETMQNNLRGQFPKERITELLKSSLLPPTPENVEASTIKVQEAIDSAIDQVIGSFEETTTQKIKQEAEKQKTAGTEPDYIQISGEVGPVIAFAHNGLVVAILSQACADIFPKAPPKDACGKCGKKEADLGMGKTLQKCARCVTAMYCSKECQTSHWPAHKAVCKILAQQNKP